MDMKKQHENRLPFTVPENYFEDFSARFDDLVQQKSPKPRRARLWISIAAAAIGLVLLAQISVLLYDHYLERNNAEYELFLLSQLEEDVYYGYFVNAYE